MNKRSPKVKEFKLRDYPYYTMKTIFYKIDQGWIGDKEEFKRIAKYLRED